MIHRSLLLSATAAGLLLSTPAFASVYEDDANQAISLAVRALRIQNEQTESTDRYFKALPIYNIKSVSYPVTWGFSTEKQVSEPTLLFSKKLSAIVSEKIVYKTPDFPNGMINVGAPLGAYYSRVYYPLFSKNKRTVDLKQVFFEPIIPSMLADDPLNNSYIGFCSFRPVVKTGVGLETPIISRLSDFDARLKTMTSPGAVRDYDGESFIRNVYSTTSGDATFMGLPARKYTLTLDSRINDVAVRLKLEALYALKNDHVVCVEVVAPEKSFDEFRKNLDPMLASIVPSYEFGSASRTTGSSLPSATAKSKAQERACRRTKKC